MRFPNLFQALEVKLVSKHGFLERWSWINAPRLEPPLFFLQDLWNQQRLTRCRFFSSGQSCRVPHGLEFVELSLRSTAFLHSLIFTDCLG